MSLLFGVIIFISLRGSTLQFVLKESQSQLILRGHRTFNILFFVFVWENGQIFILLSYWQVMWLLLIASIIHALGSVHGVRRCGEWIETGPSFKQLLVRRRKHIVRGAQWFSEEEFLIGLILGCLQDAHLVVALLDAFIRSCFGHFSIMRVFAVATVRDVTGNE